MSVPTVHARSVAPLRSRSRTAAAHPLRRSPARVIAPEMRVSDAPASVVLRSVVRRGPVSRDVVVGDTGISTAVSYTHLTLPTSGLV